MAEEGIFQWDETYPDMAVLKDDIRLKTMYGYHGSGIAKGIIVLNQIQNPDYEKIPWDASEKESLVIHRLCVDPSHQNKGIAKKLLLFAENFGRENGFKAIRLDSFIDNPYSNKLYTGNNYTNKGIISLRKGNFFCYEKMLA